MRSRASIYVALFLLGGFGCSDPDPVHRVPPKIQVEDEAEAPIEVLQFGELPVDDSLEQSVYVRSLTAAILEVEGVEIVGEGAEHFFVEDQTLRVAGGDRAPITVSFRPKKVGVLKAALVIHSNDRQQPSVEVELTGTGIDSAIRVEGCLAATQADPQRCARTLVVAPEPLDMGNVVEGTAENARITVTNLGRKALELESVQFEDPEQAEAWGFRLPRKDLSQTIAGLSSAGFVLTLHPPEDLIQPVETVLVIRSSDGSQPEIRFPVKANVVPNEPPQACVRAREALTWNGERIPFAPGARVVVNPGDSLVFDARVREGCSGDPEDGEDVKLTWIVESDDGFEYRVEPGEDDFEAVFQADTIGSYRLRLEVEDSVGQVATADAEGNPALVEFWVEPQTDIGIEIRWPGARDVDLDIHLVRGAGVEGIFGVEDFYWDNKNLNWGANPPLTSPRLAVDDKGARMVETALLNGPEAGQIYSILVHVQRDGRSRAGKPACSGVAGCGAEQVCSHNEPGAGHCLDPVEASVRLFIKGEEFDFSSVGFTPVTVLGSPCDTWYVGDVIWSATPQFRPGSSALFREGQISNATCFQE